MVPELASRVALLGAALLLIAFFAAAETALLAVRPAAWLPWLEQGQCRGRLWARLHRHQPVVRGTMMTGGVATVYLFGYLATCLMLDLNVTWSPVIGFLLSAVIVVPLGVALPVNYTAQRPEGVAIALAWPITVISVLLWPVTFLLRGLMRLVLLARGVTRVELHAPPTEEELRTMLAQSDKQGVLPEQQRQMLYGVLDFADQTTAQVMTPRPDMVSADADAPLSEALSLALEHHHRRLPVYEENDDNIVGVLYVKDALPYLRDKELSEPARVAARPAFYVPESLPARELLRQLQQSRQTVAIVRDEFGGTAGLVTVENLVEQIVGPIRDEDDLTEEPEIVETGPEEYSCSGLISLHRLENLLHVELPVEDYESLAGLVLALAGHIPGSGESFAWGQLSLTAERVSRHRLERVGVSKLANGPEQEGTSPAD